MPCWLAGAAENVCTAAVTAAVFTVSSGPRTYACAVSIGRVAPTNCCGENGPNDWVEPFPVLYGGPYCAIALVSASSESDTVTKPTGSDRATLCIVSGFASGEEKIAAQATTSTKATAPSSATSRRRS